MACGGGESTPNDGVLITPIDQLATPAAGNNGPVLVQLRDFTYPIADGCLPKGDQLMPNAPRTYRNGIHEGIDFYDVDSCARIARGTEVIAAQAGRVVRADLNYTDLTRAELDAIAANPTAEKSLDKYRGRQVWVEHGVDGEGSKIVSRYAHLSGIAPGIAVGTSVTKGQLVAYVGESGTPESISNPGKQMHLHFEVRLGDSYLGKGLPAAQVRSLYLVLFTP